MSDALIWWLAVQLFGAAALPLTLTIFTRLPDRGVFFARAVGLLVPAYATWVLASLHVLPYARISTPAFAALLFVASVGALRLRKVAWWSELVTLWRRRRAYLLTGEVLFALLFAGWCWLRAYTPDIVGTEKFMDMAFINAINRSQFFPPYDPWLSGATINYYYLGHLIMASLIRATGVAPTVGFVVSIPMLAALTGTSVYSIAGNLVFLSRGGAEQAPATLAGLAAATLCTVLGNLAGALQILQKPGPPLDFNWWDPSRVIPRTINEFPFFSFLLADLHAHVMVVPFGLLVAALSLELSLTPRRELLWWRPRAKRVAIGTAEVTAAAGPGVREHPVGGRGRRGVSLGIVARPVPLAAFASAGRGQVLFVSSAVAVGSLYALNGWDYPTYALVLVLPLLARAVVPRDEHERLPAVPLLGWCSGVALASLVAVSPFLATYRPPTGGLGLVGDRTAIGPFLVVYGLSVVLVGTWLLASLVRDARPGRRELVIGVSVVLFMAMLLAPGRLDVLGLSLMAGLLAVEVLGRVRAGTPAGYVAGLILVVALLLAAEEVVYLRDAFRGSPDYRMNTVFKFGYVAWLLLSIAGAYSLSDRRRLLARDVRAAWLALVALLVAAGLVYPALGSYSKSQGFANLAGLDGLSYLRLAAPGDEAAIRWLQTVPGRPVILEAVGGEYTNFARVSTYTGLPTVLGWAGHEAQWGHDSAQRAADVATLYTTEDRGLARNLLSRYGVRYVVIGTLERQTYTTGLAKFAQMGRVVFDAAGTRVVDVGQ